jgi:phosphocarrier protein
MYSRSVTIVNKSGLHARPASVFVQRAGQFGSKICIKRLDSDEETNAKSIIRVLSQGITKGTTIAVMAEGDDEQEAVDTLVGIIEDGIGED